MLTCWPWNPVQLPQLHSLPVQVCCQNAEHRLQHNSVQAVTNRYSVLFKKFYIHLTSQLIGAKHTLPMWNIHSILTYSQTFTKHTFTMWNIHKIITHSQTSTKHTLPMWNIHSQITHSQTYNSNSQTSTKHAKKVKLAGILHFFFPNWSTYILFWLSMMCSLSTWIPGATTNNNTQLFEPRMPILSSGLPLVTPPNARSTMKAVTLSSVSPWNGEEHCIK